jgi:F-type H+-transporting ATPase subunit b
MAVDVEVVKVVETAEPAVGMPQLDPSIYPNLIFWLLVALIALYLILNRIALPRISTVLLERNEAISNDLEQAATFKRNAEQAEAAYDAALAEARRQSEKISAENKVQINKELSTLMAKAEAEIAAKTAESTKRIGEIRDSAAKSVEEVARATAKEIVAAFLPAVSDAEKIDAAVQARLKG